MSFGWVGLVFQILLEMTCLGIICHIQKVSWSLDAKNPPKKCLTFETLFRQRFVWPSSLMKFWYFRRTLFFSAKPEKFTGKKCTALFQTHNWEKSSFFQRPDIRPLPGPNRVNQQKSNTFFLFSSHSSFQRYIDYVLNASTIWVRATLIKGN